MARYTGPRKKILRKFGMLPESPPRWRRGKQRRRRVSDYGVRLQEKQKLKFIYGILERQLRRYLDRATHDPQNTGTVLFQLLESRLDNLVFRLGLSKTRRQARQLVNHGHVLVEGKKIDIPSYNVGVGQAISLTSDTLKQVHVQQALEEAKEEPLSAWLERKGPVGKLARLPNRDEIAHEIDESLVIECYSR